VKVACRSRSAAPKGFAVTNPRGIGRIDPVRNTVKRAHRNQIEAGEGRPAQRVDRCRPPNARAGDEPHARNLHNTQAVKRPGA